MNEGGNGQSDYLRGKRLEITRKLSLKSSEGGYKSNHCMAT